MLPYAIDFNDRGARLQQLFRYRLLILKVEGGRSRCGFCGGSLYLEAEDSPFARDLGTYVAKTGAGASRRAS